MDTEKTKEMNEQVSGDEDCEDNRSEIRQEDEEGEEEEEDRRTKQEVSEDMKKRADDDSDSCDDEDLSMFDDDDDDDVDGKLYGQKRRRPDFSTGAPPGSFEMFALNRKEMEDRRIRHHEVIRKILAEFDIEEVKERYRGRGIIRDYSHANRKFRLWLEKVMGNDRIQLSDGKWNELFRQKVNEDYELKLKERERQLADAEIQRLQKLRLQGILTSDDPRNAKDGHRNSSNRSKKKSTRTYNDHSSKHQDLYTRPLDDIETQMEIINKTSDRSKENQKCASQEDVDRSQEEEDRRGDAKANEESSKELESDYLEDDFDDEDNLSSSNHSSNGHLGISGIIRPDRNPEIKNLYKEEDLHQLYAHAEKMIRPTHSLSTK